MRRTPRTAWGVRHFFAYKMPGEAGRFAKNDFAALRAIYKRWSPEWTPSDAELAPVRECFADPAGLEAAMGYYRALPFSVPAHLRTRIAVDTVAFAGTSDTLLGREDYERARRMFERSYVIEEVPGGLRRGPRSSRAGYRCAVRRSANASGCSRCRKCPPGTSSIT